MEKINVLFLAEELRVGGAESYFYKIENNIDRNIFNFFCMAVNGDQYNNLKNPSNYYFYSFSPIDRVKKIKDICLKNNIRVIHSNSLKLAFCAVFVKMLLKNKLNIKIMYTKHNLTFLEKISKKCFAQFLNKYVDLVNPICNVEKEILVHYGVNENKIETIYNGTNIKDFAFKDKKNGNSKFSVGILARLSKEKRHDIFIDIAKKILEKNNNVNFYIAGDGPEKENIKNLIIENKLENKVLMLGNVNAVEFLKKIDYLLLVSDREVFPMSILEAMASGCVVIARNVGGIKELVTPTTGFLVDGDNPSKYANVLFKLFAENQSKEIVRNARKFVEEKFTLEIMMENIENLYKKLYDNNEVENI